MTPYQESFVLAYTGAADLTEFAGLDAVDVSDAWFAYGDEVLHLEFAELADFADKMTGATL